MITLRGIAWDHPRGIDPLRAAGERFTLRDRQPVQLIWHARPLQEFEDTPLDELGRTYDLIAIDHPLIGDATVPRPALRDLTSLVSSRVLADSRRASLGPSFASYRWQGHQYALPIDAAAQVAAYRPDLIGCRLPRTWTDLSALAESLPAGRSIALAASPTHVYASWLSLCHQYAPPAALRSDGRPRWWSDEGIDAAVGEASVRALYRLLDLCVDESLSMDPIMLMEELATGDRLVYTPVVFGYSTYGRDTVRHRLKFAAPPSRDGCPAGTVLGGVGMAISARSQHPQEAAEFLELISSGRYQSTNWVRDGGQPAAADAWADRNADQLTNDFFAATRETVQRSFLRPRIPGYPAFQAAAGRLLHDAAGRRLPAGEVVAAVTSVWHDLCRARPSAQ